MTSVKEALSFAEKTYDIEIEIDFYILGKKELTWHVTVQFLKKDKTLIKSVYFNKKNTHLKSALREVYWDVNNDLLIRHDIIQNKLPNLMLDDGYYIDEIYPMVQRLRTSRKLSNLEKRIVFQNTKYL